MADPTTPCPSAAFGEAVNEFGLADLIDWMLRCDGCGLDYPTHEDLLGGGSLGLAEARRRAALDGWASAKPDRDLCPRCNRPEGDGG